MAEGKFPTNFTPSPANLASNMSLKTKNVPKHSL